MCLLIESICYENGVFVRLPFHQSRLDRSRQHYFGDLKPIVLDQCLKVPESLTNVKVKCRVTYGQKIEAIEYETYIPKIVKSIRLVKSDTIDYSYKLKDRELLNSLFLKRCDADDIVIVKNGYLTDSCYANVVFLRNGSWFTPANPLLPGTRREYYLRNRMIFPLNIKIDDLNQFVEVRLINAMRSIEDSTSIPIERIYF